MTTNHRPALESKKGKTKPIGDTISHARGLTQQTKLKYRTDGKKLEEGEASEAVMRLKRELLQGEEKATKRLKVEGERESDKGDGDSDESEGVSEGVNDNNESSEDKGSLEESVNDNRETKTTDIEKPDGSDSESESDSDSDSESFSEVLQELNKLKQEKQQQEEQQQAQLKQESIKQTAKSSNPLIDMNNESQAPKKSWRSTPFSKKASPAKTNDEKFTTKSIESEYHQSFMNKYIQ